MSPGLRGRLGVSSAGNYIGEYYKGYLGVY